MKIGIDGTTLAISFPCGSKHYAQQLVSALARIDKDNEYIIFSKKHIQIPNQANFKLKMIPRWIPLFKRQVLLNFFAKKEGVDVFHFLEPFGSAYMKNLKVVTTVHDFDLGKIYPKITSPRKLIHRIYAETVRKFTIQNTSHFIAVSKNTKKQLMSYLRKEKMKKGVTVIHEAQSKKFRVIKRFTNADKKFLLCLGDYSPRKNIPKIMETYKGLDEKIKNDIKLKIIISTKMPEKVFLKKAKQLEIEKNVELIESPKLKELVKLYNQAIVFLYPSIYEGFGLPILEAMACGCPVITSNRGSMKEVAGNAAILVNPTSSVAIGKAIKLILQDKKIGKRYIKRGLERIKKFSWDRTAKKTLLIYNSVPKES